MNRRLAVAAMLIQLAACPAFATFHLMAIQEVLLGDPPDGSGVSLQPNQRAQYVMLRMTNGGQNVTNGTSLRVEDADGNLLGTFGTLGNVSNGGGVCSYPACPAIMVGTLRADNLFTFSFNRVVNGLAGRVALPIGGGRVCYVSGSSVLDCVAWGNFDCTRSGNCKVCSNDATVSCSVDADCGVGNTCNGGANVLRIGDANGNTCDRNYGAPAAPGGVPFGHTLTRTTFDCVSKENATQFTISYPHPVNNAGQNNNADADGDGLVDVLDCDDANAAFLWPLANLQNLRAGPDPLFSYSQAAENGTGVTYDVACGSLAALNGFSDATCFLNDDTTGSVAPPSGDAVYCVTRASSSAACGGTGTYGAGTAALDPVCTPP